MRKMNSIVNARGRAVVESAKQSRSRLLRLRMECCLAMTVFFLFAPSACACPLCKEAISKMGEIWTAVGFNLSIYFMIATPFLLVAGFGIVLYLNYRKMEKSDNTLR